MAAQNSKKKLVYIMGCGRSGTTILGVALGNGVGCLDLGEVVDFLKRKGVPNGHGPETETGQFWKRVADRVSDQDSSIFEQRRVKRLVSLERHERFPRLLLGLNGGASLSDYAAYINLVYGSIAECSSNKSVYIDSSKYPGRALLLSSFLRDFDVRILHLVRYPVSVVESFGDKSKQDDQGYKGFFSANIYYFVINMFCSIVKLKSHREKYLKVRYEEFLQNPERVLNLIQARFELDLSQVVRLAATNQPLRKGFIFNGNRMSMDGSREVRLTTKGPKSVRLTLRNATTLLINRAWY